MVSLICLLVFVAATTDAAGLCFFCLTNDGLKCEMQSEYFFTSHFISEIKMLLPICDDVVSLHKKTCGLDTEIQLYSVLKQQLSIWPDMRYS